MVTENHGPRLEITSGPRARDARVVLDGRDLASTLDGLELHMSAADGNLVILKMPGPFVSVLVDTDAVEREYRAVVMTHKEEAPLLDGLTAKGSTAVEALMKLALAALAKEKTTLEKLS